jgi:ribose 1,5-bisphosphokinase
MSWLGSLRAPASAEDGLIGPGRLILVVGPSGAGKDTLINGARAACQDERSVVFARRIVTRPASAFEDNATIAPEAFDRTAADGAFAFWWSAHGHKYGVPVAIDAELRADRTVVCNVSRTIIPAVRRRYAHPIVVLITAPEETLRARLAARQRPSDGDTAARVRRANALDGDLRPDVMIENIGSPESGIRRLLNVIHWPGSHFILF